MNRLTLLPIFAAVLVLSACQKNSEPELTAQPYIPLDRMDSNAGMTDDSPTARRTDSDMASYRDESTNTAEPEADASATDTVVEADALVAGRSYIVQKGDTLFAIARRQYNDVSKWRAIWDANRDRVPNKDRLSIGQELILP